MVLWFLGLFLLFSTLWADGDNWLELVVGWLAVLFTPVIVRKTYEAEERRREERKAESPQ